MVQRLLAYGSLTAVLLAGTVGAATIVSINQGTTTAGDTDNVVFQGTGVINGPAALVRGRTNADGTLVDLLGLENLLATGGVGQATVSASDGGFRDLTISLTNPPGGLFSKMAFNLEYATPIPSGADLTIDVNWTGGTVSQTFDMSNQGNDSKFFTISLDGAVQTDTITSVHLYAAGTLHDIANLKQLRVGGRSIAVVPSPVAAVAGTMLLAGLALTRRRQKPSTEM